MIRNLAIILAFQLAGEVASRGLSLPLPGPVTGLVALVLACLWRPALAQAIRPAASGLLAHLSLFFVPAGVGIVAHQDVLRDQGLGLAVALMGSTALAIAAGAWAFTTVARLTGSQEHDGLKDQNDG